MKVPFIDMYRMHAPLEKVFKQRFDEILKNSAFIKGKYLDDFEKDFAQWVGTKHCIGVGSGHDGLIISLKALGVGKGDTVIAPAMTFISTVEAIHEVGASIELVDVDEDGLIDLNQVEACIQKKKVKCIIPVHLYGKMVDPHRLKSIMDQYDVMVLEDCAQAHGASIDGIQAGTIGHVSEFSFYPGKNLGALGDGGAICTSSDILDKKIRAIREHGQVKKYEHKYLGGVTSRLDNLQAAFLLEKLQHMRKWTAERQEIFRTYKNMIKNTGVQVVHELSLNEHVFHLMIVKVSKPEDFSKFLDENGVASGRHYPIPIHHMECFKNFSFYNSKYPNSEKFAYKTVSLPIFPGMTKSEVEYVCQVIESYKTKKVYKESAA
ncbi:MAG: hypothetical protein CME61_02530 [Halobacteriovoraceae bacterium]|nr:hypothetical protein [Halobacteriovoraceae bacterium]